METGTPPASLHTATDWQPCPRELHRLCATLFDQQLWCWGQDVRHRPNLLTAYGFERRPPPPEISGTSAYHLVLGDRWVALWGFGMGYGDPPHGALFLPRSGSVPRLLRRAEPVDQVWKPSHLGAHPPASDGEHRVVRQLLGDAFRWIAAYERWLHDAWGEDHRRAAVARWWKPRIPAAAMRDQWETLARQCHLPDWPLGHEQTGIDTDW